MKRFVPYFAPILTASVLAAVLFSLLDSTYFGFTTEPRPRLEVLLQSAVLGASLAVAVGTVFGVFLTLPMPALRWAAARWGAGAESAEDFLASIVRILATDSLGGLRAAATSLFVLAFAVGAALLGNRVVPAFGFDNWLLVVAFAVWTTAGAVVPVLAVRLASRRWPTLAPPAWFVWGFLAVWAYYVVSQYWTAAKPYTLWASLPILFSVGTVAVFCVMRALQHARKRFLGLAITAAAASLVVLIAYPDRSAGHAHLSSGPIIGSSAWQILAVLSDLDGDGATALIGGSDCGALDYDQRPTAFEIVGNGVDDNCSGGDLAEATVPRAAPHPPKWSKPARPPVILITVDTLRADALGRVVDDKPVTPFMDALQDGAVSFTRTYAPAAGTDESMPALMTGQYPSDWHQYGVYFGVEPTLAELLAASGYQTVAVVLLPWVRAALIHGFQLIDNSLGEYHYRDERRLSSPDTTALALKYIDERDPEKPLFIWVHYFDVHLPRFQLPQLTEWLGRDAYMHNVHLVDRSIGELLTGLDSRGLLDPSVVMLAADHGEALGEHNLITHGWGVWESIVRVPLSLRLPGVPPRSIDQPVSLVDVMPTLMDYLGVTDGVSRAGKSLMPLIAGQPFQRGPIFIEAEVDDRATFFGVLDDSMKLFVNLRRSSYHLYDLAEDPDEQFNLIESRSDEAERLLGLLGTWRDETFNDVRLDRKRDLWESRAKWRPEKMITNPNTWRTDEALGEQQ